MNLCFTDEVSLRFIGETKLLVLHYDFDMIIISDFQIKRLMDGQTSLPPVSDEGRKGYISLTSDSTSDVDDSLEEDNLIIEERGSEKDDYYSAVDSTNQEPGIVKLHQEIKQFHSSVSPTAESHHQRLQVVSRLTDLVTGLWPARVEIHGSFSTGLYLPSSDVDVVIFGLWEVIPFTMLERRLATIAAHDSVEVISSASVPIIRYNDKESGVKVDISFNNVTGLRTAQMIKRFKNQFPVLPPLVSVLKQFLLVRDLSTVYTGGLSSYCLILMIVSFLQLHPRKITEDDNLGVLLLEFLHQFGHSFNYDRLVVSVRLGGQYLDKNQMTQPAIISNRWTSVHNLSVENCLEPLEDAAKATFKAQNIRKSFAFAFTKLVKNMKKGKDNLLDSILLNN